MIELARKSIRHLLGCALHGLSADRAEARLDGIKGGVDAVLMLLSKGTRVAGVAAAQSGMFCCLPHPLVVVPRKSGQHAFEDGVRRMRGGMRYGSAHLPLAMGG